ncbi:TPA: hypothetical protein H1005_03365 [archaeon]|uniref:Uncharacterized protein n=1 Tax=Candidatus Naiadarchaeum limnaeum TaxID=2756139 RepID=A0A832V383_9ARCH|nr:hypothetical protein [Candidatus Naiadarchaeales archaeon SRR2090153.bin1042]HIK00177.1 hypothetical protein [Candidatus Naiadarchaeum limnaeum]
MRIKKYLAIFLVQGVLLGYMAIQSKMATRAMLVVPVLLAFQLALLLFLVDFEKLRAYTWKTAKENLDLKLIDGKEKKKQIKEMLKIGAINVN